MRLGFHLRHNKVHKTIYLVRDIVYKFVKFKLIIKAQGNHLDYVLCSYFLVGTVMSNFYFQTIIVALYIVHTSVIIYLYFF